MFLPKIIGKCQNSAYQNPKPCLCRKQRKPGKRSGDYDKAAISGKIRRCDISGGGFAICQRVKIHRPPANLKFYKEMRENSKEGHAVLAWLFIIIVMRHQRPFGILSF